MNNFRCPRCGLVLVRPSSGEKCFCPCGQKIRIPPLPQIGKTELGIPTAELPKAIPHRPQTIICTPGTPEQPNPQSFAIASVVVIGISLLVARGCQNSTEAGHVAALILIAGLIVVFCVWLSSFKTWFDSLTADERKAHAERYQREELERLFGRINPMLPCPHCEVRGGVRTKEVVEGRGVSGKKLAAAALTGGWSIVFAGLSRNEKVLECHCDNCKVSWHIE
jgi:hypothetical protein